MTSCFLKQCKKQKRIRDIYQSHRTKTEGICREVSLCPVGYYWWIGERKGTSYYFANGYGGQFICVFPELNLLVIAQSDLNNDHRDAGEQWYNTLSLIMNDVLNAVH